VRKVIIIEKVQVLCFFTFFLGLSNLIVIYVEIAWSSVLCTYNFIWVLLVPSLYKDMDHTLQQKKQS
jgi:hypothetical protein